MNERAPTQFEVIEVNNRPPRKRAVLRLVEQKNISLIEKTSGIAATLKRNETPSVFKPEHFPSQTNEGWRIKTDEKKPHLHLIKDADTVTREGAIDSQSTDEDFEKGSGIKTDRHGAKAVLRTYWLPITLSIAGILFSAEAALVAGMGLLAFRGAKYFFWNTWSLGKFGGKNKPFNPTIEERVLSWGWEKIQKFGRTLENDKKIRRQNSAARKEKAQEQHLEKLVREEQEKRGEVWSREEGARHALTNGSYRAAYDLGKKIQEPAARSEFFTDLVESMYSDNAIDGITMLDPKDSEENKSLLRAWYLLPLAYKAIGKIKNSDARNDMRVRLVKVEILFASKGLTLSTTGNEFDPVLSKIKKIPSAEKRDTASEILISELCPHDMAAAIYSGNMLSEQFLTKYEQNLDLAEKTAVSITNEITRDEAIETILRIRLAIIYSVVTSWREEINAGGKAPSYGHYAWRQLIHAEKLASKIKAPNIRRERMLQLGETRKSIAGA